MEFFFSLFFWSSRAAETRNFCFLVPGRLSNAPDLMKLSMVLLLTSLLLIRSMKSSREVKGPLAVLSFTISSTTLWPMLLIAERPYRMAPDDTENPPSPSLISGGMIFMPIWRQVKIYSDTLETLSFTDVIRAAINSTG